MRLHKTDLQGLRELREDTAEYLDKMFDWIMPLELGAEYATLTKLRDFLDYEIKKLEGQ